jgi:hypothetical protein
LSGFVCEHHLDGRRKYFARGDLKWTPRSTFHKIDALFPTWAISFRGPWKDTWRESRHGKTVTLTHGRKEVK